MCSPTKALYKYEANPQKNKHAEEQSQQIRFATLFKSHPCTDAPPGSHITPAKHVSTGDHLWETAPLCQISFKRLKLEKVVIYNC